MGLILDDFRSLRSLLLGIGASAAQPESQDSSTPLDLSDAGPVGPATLVRAIRIYGIMGCVELGEEGDFAQDSPQAAEAIRALLDYHDRLQASDGDEQAFWALLPETGPLERYGWDSEGLPPLGNLPDRPDQVREGSLKEFRNYRKLVAALAAALAGKHGFEPPLLPGGLDGVAQVIEDWAKRNRISGLGETTVKGKIRAAWTEIDGRPDRNLGSRSTRK